MTLSYNSLEFNPFRNHIETKSFGDGEPYSKAIDALTQAARKDVNFIVLTGGPGMGKSTLIERLKKALSPEYVSVEIGDRFQKANELFLLIARHAGINRAFSSKGAFLVHFNTYVQKIQAENKKVLLIMDELSTLEDGLVKELKFLSDIKIRQQKMITILLAGENISLEPYETNELANTPVFAYRLDGMAGNETNRDSYQLPEAGRAGDSVIPHEAIQNIPWLPRSSHREVIGICDCAIDSGYELKLPNTAPAIMEGWSQELDLPRGLEEKNKAIHHQVLKHTKNLFSALSIRFETWELVHPLKNAAVTDIGPTIDFLKKALEKSRLFIHSGLQRFFLKGRHYWHPKGMLTWLLESGLWKSALGSTLVLLATALSLWYYGILPIKTQLPEYSDFQAKTLVPPNTGRAGHYHYDKDSIESSHSLKTKAINDLITTRQVNGKIRRTEAKTTLPITHHQSSRATYSVQVGAFLFPENADKTVLKLRKKGYSPEIVAFKDSRGRYWHTVRIGEYGSLEVAKKHAVGFSGREKMDAIVISTIKHLN